MTFRNICCLHHSFENVIIPCLSLIQAQKFEIKFTALFFLFSTSITKSLLSSSPSLPASLELSHLSFCCVLVLSHVQLFYPINCSPPGFSVRGIFQARILEGLPFPTPGDHPNPGIRPISLASPTLQADSLPLEPPGSPAAAAAAESLQSRPTLCDPIDGSLPGSPGPWDTPGKNTGVGCHFLLQCVKVKSESEVAQSCPNLSDPMDCSPPGSSIHGIFQARVLSGVPLPSPDFWFSKPEKAETQSGQ